MRYIGVDPGKSSGSIAVIIDSSVEFLKLTDATELDILSFLRHHGGPSAVAVIEKLSNSAPPAAEKKFGRGSKANWSLSGSYHGLRMALLASGTAFVEITPAAWQQAMRCRSGGDKKVTKARAQELWPNESLTHWKADSLLIATYCRQRHAELF